ALEWVDYWVQRDNLPNVWVGLRRLVRQLAALGLHDDAARLAGAEDAAELKIPPRVQERERNDQAVARLRAALGDAAYGDLAADAASLAPSTATRVSASLWRTAWNWAIGRSNWMRSTAWTRASSSIDRLAPTSSWARANRPAARAASGISPDATNRRPNA